MVSRDNGREPVAVSTATWSPGDTDQIIPKDLILPETQSGSKKSRPANEAKATNIDQERAIRFVHEVLCAAQKESMGNGEKALGRRCE
jgi:hypothetical protein